MVILVTSEASKRITSGGGRGGGICPRAPVEGGRRQDVICKKVLSCLTKINFDEERADKLMMSCKQRNVLAKLLKTIYN